MDNTKHAAGSSKSNPALSAANKVKATLKLFRETFKELSNERKRNHQNQSGQPLGRLDLEAANQIKRTSDWIHPANRFGEIPGISIGDEFQLRTELSLVGLHGPYMSGIDYLQLNGKKFATSIVDSGVYGNLSKTRDVLIYVGQGGKPRRGARADQKLQLGNIALVNSMESKHPVRVIKKTKESTFTYDGLYVVNKYWRERDFDRKVVYKFELHRMPDQKRGGKERCLVSDLSQGKETRAIRVVNGVDEARPGKFGYITENVYGEDWCGKKIEGGGLRYQLEVYRAGVGVGVGGWGVRSRGYISSGSFVCEFVGKIRQIEEGDDRELVDDYCFVCCSHEESGEKGFVVDASKVGNVGRFIRHGCGSSSLVAKRVVFEHGDSHVMFFAAKNIPPMQELTYESNVLLMG